MAQVSTEALRNRKAKQQEADEAGESAAELVNEVWTTIAQVSTKALLGFVAIDDLLVKSTALAN